MLPVAEAATIVGTFEDAPLVYTRTITTLYDLIEALHDQVEAEDDAAVTAAMVHLCKAGHVKFLNGSEDREVACAN